MNLSGNILFTLAVLITTNLYSQPLALNFLNYNINDHLGSNNVRKTIQDSRGYIWCATQDGLYRFDGNEFTAYNKLLSRNHTLTGSDIRDLLIVNDTLWTVNSYGGIDAIDIITGNVVYSYNQQYHKAVQSVLFLSLAITDNRLLIGSDKGLYFLDIKKKILQKPSVNKINGFNDTTNINKILWDSTNLWIFCDKGNICLLDVKTFTVTGIFKSDVARFYDADMKDSIITTGTNEGIRQFYVLNGQIKPTHTPFLATYHQRSPVFAVKKDKLGNLWFSDRNNLLKVSGAFDNIQYVISGKLVYGKDLTSSVYGIFFDNKNNLWLSSQEGLLFSTNRPAAFLAYTKSRSTTTAINRAYFLYPDNDTTVYVCAEDGLYRVNPGAYSLERIDAGKTYFYAFRDFKNNLVVSNDEGAFILNNNRLIPFAQVYPEFSGFGIIMLNSYIKLNDTLYAFGTQNRKGIFLWNPLKKIITNIYSESPGIRLADDNVNTLFKESNEKLWILCDNSISVFDARMHSITNLDLINPGTNYKYSIFFDICRIHETYYVASYSNGILLLDKNYQFIKEISTKNNLANNGVYKLLSYKDSLLMATTNNGLSVLTINTGNIRNYYDRDGIQSSEFEELSGNTRNNLVFAGGKYGFTIINPTLFTKNTLPPVVYFSNISVELDRDGKIDTSNLVIRNITIPHNAIQTIIHFSGINYSNPQKTTFHYRITELQKDWIDLYNQNFITLIGLSPGTYHLQVQAFNEDGIPGLIKELTLVFLPKWYQTWWFKLLIAACVLAVIYLVYWIRIRQLKKVQQIRTKLAGDLHDDLGSTMNSVKIYANLAIMEKQSDKYLSKIKESTHEAITGIRDMIWVLDDKKGTVEHLLTRLNTFALPLLEAKSIAYHQQVADESRDYKLGQEEKRNLFMILKESINNAVKYSDCNEITLSVVLRKTKPEISVIDNGAGFDAAKEPEGNGIKNMIRRADEIKYKFQLNSSPNGGTSIHLRKL